jgi:DNA repair protein RadC
MSDTKNLTIKEWSEDDRPREKLISKGISSLSDAELLAIIIGSGSREETAVSLSKRILYSTNNNLHELGKLDLETLMRFKGIGEAKAISIVATLELGRRRKLADAEQKPVITCSTDAFRIFQPIIGDLPYEEFWLLLLNNSARTIERVRLSMGGIAGTVVDIRMILKIAIEKLATSIILCHNHPSGRIVPSDEDIQITKQIGKALPLINMKLNDHIIIGDQQYYSFADNGLI